MIEGMGVGPAGSLLGAVALALVPMPVLFYYYGAKLREKSTFAPTSVSSICLYKVVELADFACAGFPLRTKTVMIAREAWKTTKWVRLRWRAWRVVRRRRREQSSIARVALDLYIHVAALLFFALASLASIRHCRMVSAEQSSNGLPILLFMCQCMRTMRTFLEQQLAGHRVPVAPSMICMAFHILVRHQLIRL